ncbi:unnamed protein product [Litomosoides sigmodontis]|uniref:Uncharacterized protein n=1 Tax=Litomosoides sigmodontis TaxID=42156 RepID=A0A3P7JX49_LITSI|nr:unnamed protein product [Litomosoides sigmodontis]
MPPSSCCTNMREPFEFTNSFDMESYTMTLKKTQIKKFQLIMEMLLSRIFKKKTLKLKCFEKGLQKVFFLTQKDLSRTIYNNFTKICR